MIDASDNMVPFVPSDTAHTQLLTQKMLDECARAIGRDLWDYEVKILDEILAAQDKVNLKLTKKGQLGKTHSLDEVVHVFCQRVLTKDQQKLTDEIMKDGGKKNAIYKQLQGIADR